MIKVRQKDLKKNLTKEKESPPNNSWGDKKSYGRKPSGGNSRSKSSDSSDFKKRPEKRSFGRENKFAKAKFSSNRKGRR